MKHFFVAKLAESFGFTRVAESRCDFRYSEFAFSQYDNCFTALRLDASPG
ncbi:hypothetical protein RMSM_06155 [Rhodopirellula maiorica SM1]|uniref:Uncharacterized protein n=1 Tax=Rhodopirellula maiorica SM1 TaxID=1265738 RepID=M5RSI2_9BACT|nr:hypothetical protein RMSM_06155 [Rhodopirellula maiorica SM1]